MPVHLKSVQKKANHFRDTLRAFDYQSASVTPAYIGNDIYITVKATSDNPVGKLAITGKYSMSHDVFYIEPIGLITDNENFFFDVLKTLHDTLTNIQIGLDHANKNK